MMTTKMMMSPRTTKSIISFQWILLSFFICPTIGFLLQQQPLQHHDGSLIAVKSKMRLAALAFVPPVDTLPPAATTTTTTTTTATTVPLSVLLQQSTTTTLSPLQYYATTTTLDDAAANSMTTTTSSSSSSLTVAIQEYKTPTAEELAQKKMTFNMIFWGGGFVAPFLATVFYFGFRFWER